MRKTKSLVEELAVSDMKEVKLQRNLGRFRISWVASVGPRASYKGRTTIHQALGEKPL